VICFTYCHPELGVSDAFEVVEVGIGIGKGTRLREMRRRRKMVKALYVCLECNL